jgi:tetratricopeptide (TPR) repeat protein
VTARSDREPAAARFARIARMLAEQPAGMHRLAPPAAALGELPPVLAALYRRWNGLDLFGETLHIVAAPELAREGPGLRVGELGKDTLYVDPEDRVWRCEGDTGEMLPEGTRVDRWLAGFVASEATLYSADGEFADGLFDEDGDVSADAQVTRERRALKHDRGAAAPRWRLARALTRLGQPEKARDQLEEVVAQHPGFAWAWFDLARLAEAKGDLVAACADACAAADADPAYEHAPYFLAYAARIARAAGDETRRSFLAGRALAADPDLARRQRDGAAAHLDDGDAEAAAELLEVSLALAPRDVRALALARRIERATKEG